MARPYVTRIESNVKSAASFSYALGRRTLIVGPSGKGKSAVVNALELAGSGRASDIAGRTTLAKDADLSSLTTSDPLYATAALSTGELASFELHRGKRARRTGPELAFPLREVREAILGSPETARKWILNASETIDWNRDVLPLLSDSAQKLASGVAHAGLTGGLEEARKRSREAVARAGAARAVRAPAEPPLPDAEIVELERAASTWKTQANRSRAQAGLAKLRTEFDQAKRLVAETRARQAAALQEQQAFAAPSGDVDVMLSGVTVCEALARAKALECAICGGRTDPDELARRAERARGRIEALLQQEKQREGLEASCLESATALAIAERTAAGLGQALAAASKAAVQDEEALPEMGLEEAESRLRSAYALRAAWLTARNGEEQALRSEKEAREWAELAGALASAMEKLVERARIHFEGMVQRFLPREDLFGVDLLDGDRAVLRVGLRRLLGDRMVLHSALSGAEWARVTAALALATAPAEGFAIVAPEERAVDPVTLEAVLAALGQLSDDSPQIVVTACVPPRIVPAGWDTIWIGMEPYRPAVIERVVREEFASSPQLSLFD